MELFKSNKIEVVKGYFQTFDYFDPKYKKDIFESFTFLPGVVERAHQLLEDIKFKRGNVSRKFLFYD